MKSKKNKIVSVLLVTTVVFSILLIGILIFSPSEYEDEELITKQKPYHIWNASTNYKCDFTGEHGIAVSKNNSIYIVGTNLNISSNYGFITKYYNNGTKIWTKNYSIGSYLYKVNIDNNGYIYAVGTISNNLLLIKYNSNGDIVWNYTIISIIDQYNAFDLAIDQKNDIYITGTENTGGKLFLAKVNQTGNLQYNYEYQYTGFTRGLGIKTDNESIYIAGSNLLVSEDLLLVKIDKNGTQIWNSSYGSANIDRLTDIAISTDGYIYGIGYYDNAKDIITIKYHIENGTQVWNKTYDTGSVFDRGYTIYLFSNNEIIIGGQSDGFNGYKGILMCYNSSGDTNWIYKFTSQSTFGTTIIYDMDFSSDTYLYSVVHQRNDGTSKFDPTIYKFGFNFKPILSNHSVSPISGNNSQQFTFKVKYIELTNKSPDYIKVNINGTFYDMIQENSLDNNYVDGVIYNYTTQFTKGVYEYYFNTSNGLNETIYPETGKFIGPLVVNTELDLLQPKVEPTTGIVSKTDFNFSVIYIDLDNDIPISVNLILNNQKYQLSKKDITDNNYTDGVIYYKQMKINQTGDYQFYFNASDGTNITQTQILNITIQQEAIQPNNLWILWIIIPVVAGISIATAVVYRYRKTIIRRLKSKSKGKSKFVF